MLLQRLVTFVRLAVLVLIDPLAAVQIYCELRGTLPVLTNCSAHSLFRPPAHDVITSAIPHDSSVKVDFLQSGKNMRPNLCISNTPLQLAHYKEGMIPTRIIAAFALFPHSRPSMNPAAAATMFFSAPQRQTPATSWLI